MDRGVDLMPVTTGTGWYTTHNDYVSVFSRGRFKQRWHWHVRAQGNNEIIEQGESYVRRIDAIDAALRHHPTT